MARSRNIKPGFFTNEELADLPFAYRLLFIGLWTVCDKDGKCEDRPKKIKMEVFPADDVDVDAGLCALQSSGFIERYEVDGKRYLRVLAWAKHQTPHVRESASAIPNPCLGTAKAVPKHDLGSAEALPRSPDSLIPDSLLTEPNGSSADAPLKPAPDPIWGTGLAFLIRKGLPMDQARKFLGKLKQAAGDVEAGAMLADAEAQDITEPIPWLMKAASNAKAKNSQGSIHANHRESAADKVRRLAIEGQQRDDAATAATNGYAHVVGAYG